ncbi:hypothetical protein, partial [Xanthomonas campestris]|uniref:hypothetical protein n=1 Tax=Xanthomonas campestris TaxID=339 RepID=UPI001E5A755B
MHTDAHKFKLPAKIRNALITAPMILLVLWGLYAWMVPSVPKPAAKERSEAETTQLPASAAAPNTLRVTRWGQLAFSVLCLRRLLSSWPAVCPARAGVAVSTRKVRRLTKLSRSA